MIHEEGMVCTGAGMLSPQPLQNTQKSHIRADGRLNMKTIMANKKRKRKPTLWIISCHVAKREGGFSLKKSPLRIVTLLLSIYLAAATVTGTV